jgi:hypothetical protein
MSTQTYCILGGLAIGALLGYQFAPRLIGYQPYRFIHDKIAPASPASQIANTAAAVGQVTGSAVMAPVQSAVAAGKEVYSEIQSLFGSDGQ